MKKIILFHPRGYDSLVKSPPIGTVAAPLAPMGLASIAAVLRNAGHHVVIWDGLLYPTISNAEWTEKIIGEAPDYLGLSVITPSFHDAYNLCTLVKEKAPTITTIMGGVHPSWGKGDLLTNYPAVDIISAGEGEYALRDLLNGVAPATIPGIYLRDQDSVIGGKPQTKESLCTLDDLPFPAYDLLEAFPKHYSLALFNYPKHPNASIISSRGCVYHCSFCDRSVFENGFRWNSPEYTAEQVAYLATEFGVKHIMFYDDLFTLNRGRVSRLCELLRKAKKKVTFNCIVRIGHIDQELIKELKSAGVWMVSVGIESGDQVVLDNHKEGLNLEQIRADILKLHKAGIWVKGLFMMGFPGETPASFQKTIDFATSLPLAIANLTAFTPYPGAPITRTIDSMGTFDHSEANWANLDCEKVVFLPHENPDKAVLEAQYGQFLHRFYNRPFAYGFYNHMMLQSPHSYYRVIKGFPHIVRYLKGL